MKTEAKQPLNSIDQTPEKEKMISPYIKCTKSIYK